MIPLGGGKNKMVFTRGCLGDIMSIDEGKGIDRVIEGGQGVTGSYK